MGVSGQRHASTALCPGERTPSTHCTGGWVGLRAGLDTEVRGKILFPCQGSNPDRSDVQAVARHYTDWATLADCMKFTMIISSFTTHKLNSWHVNNVEGRKLTNTKIYQVLQRHDSHNVPVWWPGLKNSLTVTHACRKRRLKWVPCACEYTLWHSVPLSLLSGYPVTSFPFLPLRGAVVCCPFLEFAVEAHSLTVWATERYILSSKFIYLGFWFRKSSSPRFLPVGQALRDLLFWFVCIWFIFYYYYYIYYLLSLVIVYSVKCFYSALFTACFILLLLLNGYVKNSGYFGSFLAAYCFTQIHDPV
jgi:hypothetical protein